MLRIGKYSFSIYIYFFNKHISRNIRLTCLKTAIHVSENHLGERVSQNFDIGLSLNFIACRSGGFQKNLRHPYLDQNVFHVQNIKVEKSILNLPFS